MNFKEFFRNKLIVQEVSDRTVDKLPAFLKGGGTPFDHIFGDNMRMVERMKQTSEYKAQIRNSIIEDYELDFDKWVGYKITDKDKKNPTRIGKLLSQRKQTIEKYIKSSTESNATERATTDSFRNQLQAIDKLLKVTDLQKSYVDAQQSKYYIVYSRAPVDVVRMSDHEWSSCHSEGGAYFYCALADASLNAGIAYVITEEDMNSVEDWEQEEIFKDGDRGIEGIRPQARIRIRSVYDKKGNSLAVPSLKVYKNNKFTLGEDFKNQLIEWAKRQDTSHIDWDNVLTLKGGSYEDSGTDIEDMVQKIWGKDIKYKHDPTAERGFENDYNDDNQQDEEHWWDEMREDFDPDTIYREALGTSDWHSYFSIDYDINDGSLALEYDIPDKLVKLLDKSQKWQERSHENTTVVNDIKGARSWEAYKTIRTYIDGNKLKFDIEKTFYADEYGEFYGDNYGRFRDDDLKKDVQEYFREILTAYIGEPYYEDLDGFYELRMCINKKICNMFHIEYNKSDGSVIEDITSVYMYDRKKNPEEIGQYSIPTFKPEIEVRGYGAKELIGPMEHIYSIVDIVEGIEDKISRFISEKYGLGDNSYELFDISVHIPEAMSPRRFRRRGEEKTYDTGIGGVWFKPGHTKINKPVLLLAVSVDEDYMNAVVDTGTLTEVHSALEYLTNDFSNDYLDDVTDILALEDVINKLVPPPEDDEYKKQGQLELDLSGINRGMTQFDQFIKKLFEEGLGDMGKNGLAHRGGSGTQAASPTSSAVPQSKVANGVKMPFSGSTGVKPMNPGAMQNNAIDYGSIFNSKDPNTMKLFMADPNNVEGFKQHISDPKNREAFSSTIKDPNQWKAIVDMISTPSPQ